MADVQYRLSNPIPLIHMIPSTAGTPTNIPAAIPAQAGLYIILNQNNPTDNRYMGISKNLRSRFQSRQGACFELGLEQGVLSNVYAYVGTMRYRSTGVVPWTNAPGYENGFLSINIDGLSYDLEHMLIKAAQHAWPACTVTNTQKTNAIANNHMSNDIDIEISWSNGASSTVVTLDALGQLA